MTILDGRASVVMDEGGQPNIEIYEPGDAEFCITIENQCYPPRTISGESEAGTYIPVSTGGGIVTATKEEWNSQRDLIGKENVVYVYSNQYTNPDGEPIPAFKVGDGHAYLIDLPFNDDIMMRHINDRTIHVTQAEKNFWNNKVTAFIDPNDLTNLVLSKE